MVAAVPPRLVIGNAVVVAGMAGEDVVYKLQPGRLIQAAPIMQICGRFGGSQNRFDPPHWQRPPATAVSGDYTFESGTAAFFLAMYSSNASSIPGSIGGASYSLSIFFHSVFARFNASWAPSDSHCS